MCAKVTGPLMSMAASGTVGGVATFSSWKGRPYVRNRVTPSNPKSAAQTGVRSNFTGIVALYKANTATIKTNFATLAKQNSVSPFNSFTGFNQKRLSGGKYIANSPTPTEAAPANNATALAAAVNLKYVTVTWTDAVAADAWCFMIYRAIGADPTGLNSELVAVIPRGGQLFNDGPLPAGAYHYRVRAISTHGGGTALTASVTANVV